MTTELDDVRTGECLKRIAAYKGLTRSDLARRLLTSETFISKLLTGRQRLTPKMLDRFIAAIGCEDKARFLHTKAAKEHGWKI